MTISDIVPHETNQVELYIVVDVETTGLNPAHDRILSLGAVAVAYDGKIATIDRDFFYHRLDQREWIEETSWYETILNPQSTLSWWMKQSFEAQREAWRAPSFFGAKPQAFVLDHFTQWVNNARVHHHAYDKPVFTANPVSFDKPFVDQMFWTHDKPNPFDYRTLCLRSMAFRGKENEPWGTHLRANKPLVPHHAFFDAYAEAQDLVDLLNDRDETGYCDNLYWVGNTVSKDYSDHIAAIDGKEWWPNG